MNKTNHYVHRYRGYHGTPDGQCVIRTYEAAGEPPVIVCSAVRSTTYTTTSITNICEFLANEVVQQHYTHLLPHNRFTEWFRRRSECWPPFTWIEHYPAFYKDQDERTRVARHSDRLPWWRAESYHLVRFDYYYVDRVRGQMPTQIRLPDGTRFYAGDGAAGRTRIGHADFDPTTKEYVEDLIGQPLD